MRPLTKCPPDLTALQFCESLISCATDEEVKSCVQNNIQGARACVNVADVVIARIKKQAFRVLESEAKQQRFYLLVSAVRQFLQTTQ